MFVVTNIAYSDKTEEKFIFAEILKLLPTFKALFTACCGHRQALLNLIRMVSVFCYCIYCIIFDFFPGQLQDTANGARNDDVAKTNASIVDYLIPLSPEHLTYDEEDYPLPTKTHREERGWSHPEYAVLLYPQILIDSFCEVDYA